jgi:hypothetical protein
MWRRHAAHRIDERFASLSPAEVFGAIYREKLWGSRGDSEYCSGSGSHDESIVRPYVENVQSFVSGLPQPPNAVDLGCGDFNVGSQIRSRCAEYVATDVVRDLIERNARTFAAANVSFRCIDIVADPLPGGEVAFLRQVLQHLSNAQIVAVVPKLYQFRWLVVSEHIPCRDGFVANHDKPIGPGVRERFGSGVVLTERPFNLRPLEQRELCEVQTDSGIVQTIAYRLQA